MKNNNYFFIFFAIGVMYWMEWTKLLYFFLAAAVILTSLIVSIYFLFQHSSLEYYFYVQNCAVKFPVYSNLAKVKMKMYMTESDCKFDRRITGSSLIDDEIQKIIKLIIRDFVKLWFSNISDNEKFIYQIESSLLQALVSISNRCKSTDWETFLTTQLVQHLVNHLRLFKEASTLTKENSSKSLSDHFFDNQSIKEMWNKKVCCDKDTEKDYLCDLVEIFLFLTIPEDDYRNTALRSVLTEIIVSNVLLPLIDHVTHPNYVNSLFVFACSEFTVSSELFLNVIKDSNNSDELRAVKTSVLDQIAQLRSRDSGRRDEGVELKQRIASLEYLKRVIESRLIRIDKGSGHQSLALASNLNYEALSRGKLFQLPLEVILKNNITLDHFLNYMTEVNSEQYVNLYLNIECWKTSVSERFCAMELERIHQMQSEAVGAIVDVMPGVQYDHFLSNDLSSHKGEAETIYEQYLSEKAIFRVHIEDSVVNGLILRMRTEQLNENWFDEVQSSLLSVLNETDLFLPAFRRSVWYIRLLSEFELLRDVSRSDDEDSRSFDDVIPQQLDMPKNRSPKTSPSRLSKTHSRAGSKDHSRTPSASSNCSYVLSASILSSEIIREGTKSYATYRLKVVRKDFVGREDTWYVLRRYSDFHDLHVVISSKFLDLASISFPSKKMLNNLATWFVEKRKLDLSAWLGSMLTPATLQSHPGLSEAIYKFLEPGSYQSSFTQPNIVKKVEGNIVEGLRLGVRSVSSAVKSVPNTVDGVFEGLYKRLIKPVPTKGFKESFSSYENKEDIEEENIPLRIVLMLMDEIFDLRRREFWFRRRIVLFLRQVLKTMYGDVVNRRVGDFIQLITTPQRIKIYIKSFRESLWPNDVFRPRGQPINDDQSHRTRVAARACLLATVSDEFKAILGSQTSSRGVLNVYECVQYETLNRRFFYVMMNELFESLFESRVKNALKTVNTSTAARAAHQSHTRQLSNARSAKA